MAETPEDVKVKIATNCAQNFVETYYTALNNHKGRSVITSFYVKPSDSSSTKPDININGNIISNPTDLQKLFETQIQRAYYDVQSYDAHVMNSYYKASESNGTTRMSKDPKKFSVIVLISGSVKYWKEGEDGDTRGFTENVVLVPNPDVQGSNSTNETTRKWLILSQMFRLVV